MANFIERIQAKIELFRLEQRYTRRRNRRSTFVSNAIYVDGEYIYQTPASTGSSSNTSASATSSQSRASQPTPSPNKNRNRFSMPAFGYSPKETERQQNWPGTIDERS
ncbi:hypothetical protein SPI_05786 [Niveomyces insectorum RCEF 264]|uniref:Uncharacterized protein n=1 Tax=Niveomyces insectorum RCEF 264 TaxID=1081102 RepID=A0A167SFU8_9HYPO|nr:hypothetical protein SPI_05786 [Niveomyces insectorum RCEF 264]